VLDPKYIRPTEVDALVGNPMKTEIELKWKATTHWDALADLMVEADLKLKD
jgi:GDPmannose 4,6-dehydratase